MKGDWASRVRQSPALKKLDLVWTLLPIALWAGLFQIRPDVMKLHCANPDHLCTIDEVPAFDRVAIAKYSPGADAASFTTQNTAGYLAGGVPLALAISQVARGVSPLLAATALGIDLVLFAEAIAWNGVTMEVARLIVQRPRPFVYEDPAFHGREPAHYTSFYSGHTSFAALAMTTLFFVVARAGASRTLLVLQFLLGAGLTASTGLFRVLASRHFPTDVIAGALVGSLIALAVSLLHRKTTGSPDAP